MQYLAICEDDLLFHLMRNVASKQAEVLFLVQDVAVAKRIKRHGGKVRQGDLLKEDTYKRIKLHHVDQAIVFVREADLQDRISRLLRTLDKSLSIVALTPDKNGGREPEDSLFRQLQLSDIFEEFCATRLLDTLNSKKVERIRSLFDEKKVQHLTPARSRSRMPRQRARLARTFGTQSYYDADCDFRRSDSAGKSCDDPLPGYSDRSDHL